MDLIRDCVHCGFCLPTCPSYAVFEEEMDSPRGRILLMRIGHEEGETISPEMATHFDRCLGCMACVTACPSGVQYDKLIERVRPQVEHSEARSASERAYRKAIFALFTHPARLRALAPGAKLGPKLAPLIPSERLKSMLSLAPSKASYRPLREASRSPRRRPSAAPSRSCRAASSASSSATSTPATVRVLSAEGWEVHSPRSPRCCGALQMHAGVDEEAIPLAEKTIAAYEYYDRIVTNVAGCGSVMKDYGHILDTDRAREFSAKVVDVHELLASEEPQAVRKPIELTRRLPRRLPSRARAEGPPAAARAAARYPRPRAARARRVGALLRLGRDLQPAPARGRGQARRAQGRESQGHRRRRDRRRQPRLRAADRPLSRLPIYHPMTLLDMSLRGVKP